MMVYLVIYAFIGLVTAHSIRGSASARAAADSADGLALAAIIGGVLWPVLWVYVLLVTLVKICQHLSND